MPGLLARILIGLAMLLAVQAHAQTTSGNSGTGGTLWTANCSGCHGAGPNAVYPSSLNGANSGQFVIKFAAQQGMGSPILTDAQFNDIAAFIALSLPANSPNNQAIPYNSAGTAFALPNITVPSPFSGLTSIVLEPGFAPTKGSVVFSGTTATYTPTPGQFGADSFRYRGSGGGRTTDVRTATVVIANPPTPVITSGNASGTTGVAFSYNIVATNNPTSYGAANLPPGLSVSPSTGVISGTPTATGTFNTVQISATNITGTDTNVITITINLGPPVITSGGTASGAEGQVFAGYTTTVAAGTTATSFSAVGLPPGLAINPTTGVVSGTPTVSAQPTTYPKVYNATIAAANAAGPGNKSVTFTIERPVPTISSAPTASGQTGVAFQYDIVAAPGPITAYAVVAGTLPTGLSLNGSTGRISGTPTVVGGPTNVTLRATNLTGNSANFILAITIGLGLPVITSGAMPGGGEGIPYAGYQVTATNPPHTSFGATGLPAGLAISASGFISGTPSAGTGGAHSVTLSATNATGTGSAVVSLNISSIPPVITSSLAASGQTGVAFSYQITAANAPSAYSATGLPAGLAINTATGLISGAPTAVGTSNVTIGASNGSGADSKTLVITVTLGPPVITSGATASGAAGFAFNYQITASNSPASYGATGMPPGVTVNAATGLVSGTPTLNGTFNATVTATNATGTGSRAVTISIGMGLPAITSPATAFASTSVPFGYQITATNAPTSYNATGLPSGLSVDTATGFISGTPQFFGTFPVTLTATNGTGTGSGALTLVIAQSAPIVTSASTATGSAGQPFSYLVTVANGPATMSATGLPPGLAFDPVTGVLSGTPTRGGSYPVTISVSNTTGTSAFTLTIVIGFPLPSAQDLAVEVTYEEPRAITLPVTGDVTRIDVTVLPNHGIVTIAGTVATYTPAIGYSGGDSFKYTATNPGGTSAEATVTITVTSLPPTASAGAMTVTLNTPATADLRPFIKASGLTGVSIGTQPAHGRVTVDGTRVTYTPRTDFFGADSFTYIAYGNAGISSPATVTVTVVGRPDPSLDPNVGGIVDAQAQAARRFANAQAGNYQRRMESLHGAPAQPTHAAAPSPAPVATRDAAPAKPASGVSPGLMPVSLAAPLMDAAASRSLDVSGSAPAHGFAAGTSVWIGGTAQFGRRDADGTVSGLRFSSDGLSVGMDRRFGERLALGLGVGFARDETDVGSTGSRSKAKGASFAFYGTFQPSATTFIDALVGFGKLDFDSSRHVAAIDAFAVGSRKGDQAFASLAAGAEFRRDGLLVSPYGRFDFTADRLERYSETGVGDYALTFHDQKLRSTQLAMGVRLESQHETEFGRAVPRARIEYRRELQDERGATVSYADLFAGPEYSLTRAGTSRNALLLGVGSDFLFRGGLRIGIDYQAQRASGASNVQGVRLLVTQELDGKGFPSWNWQPTLFKDPVSVEAGYTFDDNVSRGRMDWEKLSDRIYSLSLGQPIPFKLGSLEKLRLVVTPAVGGEKFNRNAGLGRVFAGGGAELQYRESGAFDATTYSLVGRAHYDQYESSHRTGARYYLGVNARRSLTDRIDLFGEIGLNARNGRSDVFTTRDYAAKFNLDYSLGRRGILYLAGEYRRGDTVSSGGASLVNVGLSEVFVPDDAFEGHDFFAYRFDARTVLGTIGWNYPLGPRDSLDLSWRRVQSTPTHRPSFDSGSVRYIDNQYSLIYLMRF